MKAKIKLYMWGIILCLGIIVAACSGKDISTTNYAHTNLRNYKTFAWLPPGDTLQNDLAQQQDIGVDIRNKLNSEMQERGYTLNAQNPDLLVLVHTKLDDRIAMETFPTGYSYYGPGFYAGPWYDYYYPSYSSFGYIYGPSYIAPVHYTDGTIVIDLIDAKTKQVVWRGQATEEEYTKAKASEEIIDNIDDIFDKFPS